MFKTLISLLILASLGWWFTLGPGGQIQPCTRPIIYNIGTFDSRFNISRADFVSALAEAENVWERPSGRELFKYDQEEAKMPVNLIYDHRQAATEELIDIEKEIEDTEADYRILESRYENLKKEYEVLKATYDRQIAKFGNKRVTQKEFEEAKSLEDELNNKVAELNTVIDRMNRLAKTLNLNAKEYNAVGALRGETFEGGVYISDAEGQRINIYEFDSRDKLVRILAHELGHALGLEHVADPSAVMYYLNEDETEAITQSDLTALEALCSQID